MRALGRLNSLTISIAFTSIEVPEWRTVFITHGISGLVQYGHIRVIGIRPDHANRLAMAE